MSSAELTFETEAEWLAERRKSVGASESPKVFDAPLDVWQRKLGLAPDVEQTEPMEIGKLMEPVIQTLYTRRTGREIAAVQKFVRHPGYPYMTATLDAVASDGRLVEFKNAGAWAREWGDSHTDEIPEPYLIQVQHQMACTGAEVVDVAALIGGNQFRVYTVERHDWLIGQIEARVAEFWECVTNRTPPTWGRHDARSLAILNPECAGTLDLDEADVARVLDVESLKAQRSALDGLSEEGQAYILAVLGNNQFGRLPDGRMVKRFRQEMPERTNTVRAHVRHYYRVIKGDS